MAQKTIEHRGYRGSIKVNMDDFTLFGAILFIDEEINYRGDTFTDLEKAFQKVVDEHIQACLDNGEEPPFSE